MLRSQTLLRVIPPLLAFIAFFSLSACGGENSGDTAQPTPAAKQNTGPIDPPPPQASPPVEKNASATVFRTEHSIPHIVADNYYGVGFGTGLAQAEDNFCLLAAMWVSYEGKAAQYRGRYLGKGRINHDLFFSYINQTAGIEEIFNLPPPHGPDEDMRAVLDGYVDGYNAYLAQYGVDNIPDADCRGGAHIRPITKMDVARRMYELIGKGGRDLVWDGMIKATPPSLTSVPVLPNQIPLFGRLPVYSDIADSFNQNISDLTGDESAVPQEDLLALGQAFSEWVDEGGSNALGFGSEATDNGSGLLLGNPHWTWDGFDRFWQSSVRIPGKLQVAGMGFIGQPMIMIGHTEHVAWSHTVSAARRLALAELTLVPGNPTQYFVDGEIKDMVPTTVTIDVLEDDGTLSQRSHTFYDSVYGPITTSILGIELLPWTQATAFAMIDMNTGSARIANQFKEQYFARNVDELYEIHKRYAGNPWATTTVADSSGNTLWTDVGTVPNISNDHAARCNTPVGAALWNTFAVAVLNGAASACDVPTDENSAAPKTMPGELQPVIKRLDYVSNSNESHWLTNARAPLTGYSRVFGPENTQRAMRTRNGHRQVLDRLDALDGTGKNTFSRQDMQDLVFSNRHLLGELWQQDLATYCAQVGQMPATPPSDGSEPEMVDVSEACPIIANWGATDNLDDPGSVLFYRFAKLSLADLDFTTSYAGLPGQPMWTTPFLVNDPVNTPNGLNPVYLPAYNALADAVKELRAAGIPLDGTYREYVRSKYGTSETPLHGGTGTLGLFNHMGQSWRGDHISAGGGGPSFVMVTEFQPDGSCPDTRTLLLGSQRSQHAWSRADEQQIKYANKEWVNPPFCDDELAAAPKESVTRILNGMILPN